MNELPQRLAFLVRVIGREAEHLRLTDERLFETPMELSIVGAMETYVALAEQVDAFVTRFGRLQDTIGDKLLPALLSALGEHHGPVADNLDRAERFEWITSADQWLAMRALRNKMVHEYIEEPAILVEALNTGHEFVPDLIKAARTMVDKATKDAN